MYDFLDHFFFRHQTQSSMIFSILALVFCFVARKFRAVGRVGREVWSVKFKCEVRSEKCEVWSVKFGVGSKQ